MAFSNEETWDTVFLDGIESDLSDFLDPDHFESEVAIDENGQFLNWLEGEARLVSNPLPSFEAPTLPPVSGDFLGFTEKSGFGMSSVRTTSPLETMNRSLGLEAANVDAVRGENLGLTAVENFEALLEEQPKTVEPTKPTGFQKPEVQVKSDDLDDIPDIPMLDLMDAIEPRKPKTAAAPTQPALEPVSALEPVVALEPMLEPVVIPEPTPVLEPVVAAVPVVAPAPVIATPAPHVSTQISNVALPSGTTMRRYFDITDLLEAQTKLIEVLSMPSVPLVVFLGRAAERCSSFMPSISSIALAEAHDEGLVNVHTISAHESFRKVLLEVNESRAEGQADLTVADLSDLELDEVTLPVTSPHLLLTRITPDPDKSGRMRGTLTLTGNVGLRSGAAFLKAVVTRLESPITLML